MKSLTTGLQPTSATKGSSVTDASGGVAVRSGQVIPNVVVTIAEGAALLNGRISISEAQGLPSRVRVYLVPAEREAATNVYRFYEAATEPDGKFVLDNLAPGRYWIVARREEENDVGTPKLIRQDEALRAKVLKEAAALKKAVSFKPCEQIRDFSIQAPSSPW